MNSAINTREVTFVYDGDCPLCSKAALALRIRQDYGQLTLLNARESAGHPLLVKIKASGLDLDEGMVIHDDTGFYHGRDALVFMARYGDSQGVFNTGTRWLFRSKLLAGLTYPWMRGVRNALLKRRQVTRIDNLNLANEPLFKSVFGDSWNELPPVLQKRYATRPYTDDELILTGELDVACSGPLKWFAPLVWLLGIIPPCTENDVPVVVTLSARPDSQVVCFNRLFSFKRRKPHRFRSRMVTGQAGYVIEFMRFGIGWKMHCVWEDDRVKLKHAGYVMNVFGHTVPIPAHLLLGKGYGEEVATGDNTFDLVVQMIHPLWGQFYQYKGRIVIQETP